MSGLAFVLLVFILIALVAGVLFTFDAKARIAKGLKRGDLYSLSA